MILKVAVALKSLRQTAACHAAALKLRRNRKLAVQAGI